MKLPAELVEPQAVLQDTGDADELASARSIGIRVESGLEFRSCLERAWPKSA